MTLRFKSIDEMKKQYSEQTILEMITKHLDNVEYRKQYNKRKNDLYRSVMSDPKLRATVLGK